VNRIACRGSRHIALAAGVLLASSPAQAQRTVQAQEQAAPSPGAQVFARLSDAEVERRVGAVIDEIATHPEFVGLSVAVARGDHLIVDRGYGMADLEWDAPADASTIFRIGSVTKHFTAAAILKLADQDKLALDDPLSRYVPEFDTGGRVVTIRQLLNHTSGIPEYTTQPGFFAKLSPLNLNDAELLQLVSGKPFDFDPGTAWRYSNTNYYLLGVVVAKASGRPYAAFMQDELFTPLGLKHTHYGSEAVIIPHRAQGYSFDPDTGSRSNDAAISMNVPGGGGALISSAGDLVRWQIALTDGRAISPASFEQMIGSAVKTGQGDALYGLGVSIDRRDGQRVIGHTGGINGFNSVLRWLPDSDLRVAVISNSEALSSGIVERRIIAALTSDEPPAPRTTARPGSEAALRKFIADIAAGTPDYSTMSPVGADATRSMLPVLKQIYMDLGPLRSLTFTEVTLLDSDSYRAEFANGAADYTIVLSPDGKIAQMNYRPVPPAAK
jgi:CubicO group peptidase (beta-lactamase class C family)